MVFVAGFLVIQRSGILISLFFTCCDECLYQDRFAATQKDNYYTQQETEEEPSQQWRSSNNRTPSWDSGYFHARASCTAAPAAPAAVAVAAAVAAAPAAARTLAVPRHRSSRGEKRIMRTVGSFVGNRHV